MRFLKILINAFICYFIFVIHVGMYNRFIKVEYKRIICCDYIDFFSFYSSPVHSIILFPETYLDHFTVVFFAIGLQQRFYLVFTKTRFAFCPLTQLLKLLYRLIHWIKQGENIHIHRITLNILFQIKKETISINIIKWQQEYCLEHASKLKIVKNINVLKYVYKPFLNWFYCVLNFFLGYVIF